MLSTEDGMITKYSTNEIHKYFITATNNTLPNGSNLYVHVDSSE